MVDEEMIRVYYSTSEQKFKGTDDSDSHDIYESVSSGLLITEMKYGEYREWDENMSVSLGEEGGSFKVFVITDLNGRILDERHLLQMHDNAMEEPL